MSKRKGEARSIERAQQAKQILQNPELPRALNDLRTALLEGIAETGLGDTAMREQLYSVIKCVPLFETCLMRILNTGTLDALAAAREEAEKKN